MVEFRRVIPILVLAVFDAIRLESHHFGLPKSSICVEIFVTESSNPISWNPDAKDIYIGDLSATDWEEISECGADAAGANFWMGDAMISAKGICENIEIRALYATMEDLMTSSTLVRSFPMDHLKRYSGYLLSGIRDSLSAIWNVKMYLGKRPVQHYT
jgi:hypothetical protein